MAKTAFQASRQTVFLFDPGELVLIEDPAHPLFQERVKLPVSEALVASMMVRGFKSTITVRRNGQKAEVVDGRQRVKAAREANRRLKAEGKETIKVRAFVEQGDDADLFGVMVLSNKGRQDDDPMSEARELKKFLDMGRTEQEAAAIFCKPLSWVTNAMRLFDLAPKVQDAVAAGRVSVSAAAKLAKVDREQQVEKLGLLLAASNGGRATVKEVARAVKAPAGAPVGPMPPSRFQMRQMLQTFVDAGWDAEACVLEWVLEGRHETSLASGAAGAIKAKRAKATEEAKAVLSGKAVGC